MVGSHGIHEARREPSLSHALARADAVRAELTDPDTRPWFRPSFTLVDAKLHPPALRPGWLAREHIVRLLSAEPRPPVVSVVAPPGYGKTVLLADWASRAGEPVAWLTLDSFDNDPSVFLAYLAVAIDRIEPIDGAVAAALATPPSRVLATAVPQLAQALHAIGRPATVILDDAHRLVDRTCLDALAQLLDYLPPGLRIAIAARAEPDLPFGRMRARGDLVEITGSDLALDAEETEAIAAAAGWRLTPSEARALAERTEGWATGVYLAAVSGRREGVGRAPVDVSGRSGYIADYLRSVFEAGLQDEDLGFLARTSILEVVEPPLADAVVDRSRTRRAGSPRWPTRTSSSRRSPAPMQPTGTTASCASSSRRSSTDGNPAWPPSYTAERRHGTRPRAAPSSRSSMRSSAATRTTPPGSSRPRC